MSAMYLYLEVVKEVLAIERPILDILHWGRHNLNQKKDQGITRFMCEYLTTEKLTLITTEPMVDHMADDLAKIVCCET